MADARCDEVELKIPNADLQAVRGRLEGDHAARRESSPSHETNTLFDTPEGTLRRLQHALRLRHVGGRWLLTFKGRPRYRGSIKVREEHETEVADGDVLRTILERTGFVPQVSYEKVRESWRVDDVLVTLDHTPMGDFVELEGPAEVLPGLAERLGLDPATALRESYLALWRRYRAEHPERALPADMRFEP